MSSDCRRFRGRITDLVTGVLPESNSRELQAHLSTCAPCRDYLQALRQEDASLAEYFAGIDEDMVDRQERALQRIGCFRANERVNAAFAWGRIMKNRRNRLTLAAGIIFAAVIGTQRLFVPAPAFGLTEALKSWRDAQTVHIKGGMFLDPGNGKLERFPFESWIDRRNGCFRDTHPLGWFGDYTGGPEYFLIVSDGEYLMEVYHRQNAGRVEFTKLSPFAQRLQARTLKAFPAFMGSLDQVKGFRKVGREQVQGKTADVWEGEITAATKTVPCTRLKIWLSPSTGEILRYMSWSNREEPENSVRWQMSMDANSFEYEVSPPPDCFRTDPPEGYRLTNTKETVIARELGEDGRSRFYNCIGFTLNDGSVILAWHANHEQQKSQAHYFAELKPGGSLPGLPARIVALKPWPVQEDITCIGRHLAWTQKKGKFYEWGIYVPDRKTPERVTFHDYKVVCEFKDVEPRSFGGRPNLVGEQLAITSGSEFDTWVRGAMAELSDSGTAPKHVTYQAALDLAQQVRSSFSPR